MGRYKFLHMPTAQPKPSLRRGTPRATHTQKTLDGQADKERPYKVLHSFKAVEIFPHLNNSTMFALQNYKDIQSVWEMSVFALAIFTSRVSGRGNKIGAVFPSVFPSVSTLTAEPLLCVCVCLCPSCRKDYRAKGLCMRGTREVSQCSGVFISLTKQ